MSRGLLRLLVAAALAAGGVRLLEGALQPRPPALARLVERALAEGFGPDVALERVTVDPVDGAALEGFSVAPAPGAPPGLSASRVVVRHDLLDLLAGSYRATALTIDRAHVTLDETEAGVALSVPFHAGRGARRRGSVPDVTVREGRVTVRPRPGSTRLREGRELRLEAVEARAERGPDGRLAIRGSLATRGLGQDAVRILLSGFADLRSDALRLDVVWDPLTLEPELLATLAPAVAERLAGSPIVSGRLEAVLERAGAAGGAPPGEVRLRVRWLGAMRSELADLPGLKDLDPALRERLLPLFGGGTLEVGFAEGRLVLESLSARVGTARVSGSGWVSTDGASFRLEARLSGLDLEDPALRRALGPEGRVLGEVVEARGTLDADLVLERPPGGELGWSARVELREASLSYLGERGPSGLREGFPYRMEHVAGALRLSPEGVLLEGLEGRHGTGTRMRILGHDRTSWQGEETGYVRLNGPTPELAVTIEALDVPVDDDLHAGVAGSEFPDVLRVYRLGGVVDRVEVDVVRRSFDPVARAEVRITLDGDEFEWERLPVALRNVRGIVTLRRPELPEPGLPEPGLPEPGLPEPGRREPGPPPGTGPGPTAQGGGPAPRLTRRGRLVHVDVRGELPGEGAPGEVAVRVDVDQLAARGRLRVSARGVETSGALAAALPHAPLTKEGLAAVWRWLAPRGRADLEGEFPLEDDPTPLRMVVRLEGLEVTPDAPAGDTLLTVRDLRGVVQIVGDDVRLGTLSARLLSTPVQLEGRLPEGIDGPWTLDLRTLDALPITPELVASLERLAACSTLLPGGLRLDGRGRARLDLRVSREAGADCVTLPRVELSDLELGLRWRGGLALGASGRLLSVEGDELRALDLSLSAPGLSLTAADARLSPSGLVGRLRLKLDGYEPPPELLELIPEEARAAVTTWSAGRRLGSPGLSVDLGRDGSVALEGELDFVAASGAPPGGAPRGGLRLEPLTLSAPDPLGRRTLSGAVVFRRFSWEEEVGLSELVGRIALDRLRLGEDAAGAARIEGLSGRLEGLRFSALQAPLLWDEGLLRVEPLSGTLSGGRLSARFLLHTRDPVAYEGEALVEGFDVSALRDDLAPTGPPYRGVGTLRLAFESRTSDLADLTAVGTLRVRRGHLGDLPPIASLFAALSRLLPGEQAPAFEELEADFSLRDEVLRFRRLDLSGPLARMPGRGTLALSGHVDLTFTPDLVKSMLLPGVMTVPVVGDVLRGALQEQLFYAVRVHGDLADTRTDLVPFPPLGLRPSRPFDAPPSPPPPRRRVPRLLR